MLESQYFENRLGEMWRFSAIPYKSGSGMSNSHACYLWELCVDISGNIIFVLHSPDLISSLKEAYGSSREINNFKGKTFDEEWEIECSDLHFLSSNGSFGKNSLFFQPSKVILKRSTKYLPHIIRAHFTNFSFTSTDLGSGFAVSIANRNYTFQMRQHHNEIIDLIERGRVNNALLSHASVFVEQYDLEELYDEIDDINWFISLLNLDLNFVPVMEVKDENEQTIMFILSNTSKRNFGRHCIIDNFNIRDGIPHFFEQSFTKFQSSRQILGIRSIPSFWAEIVRQSYIDIKLGIMIITYEYILYKYLVSCEEREDSLKDISIQQKLKKANMYLRFIPSKMIKDTVRTKIRNPLFH